MKWINSWALAGTLVGSLLFMAVILAIIHGLPKFDFYDLICALILIAIGFFLHIWAGEPGEKNYPFSHSLWHVLAMSSAYFVIDLRDGKSVIEKIGDKFEKELY
jgi:hypothetical protein